MLCGGDFGGGRGGAAFGVDVARAPRSSAEGGGSASISLVVLLNIVVMGMYYWRRLPDGHVMELESACAGSGRDCALAEHQETPYYKGLEVLNTAFTFVFAAEMLLKFAAWGAMCCARHGAAEPPDAGLVTLARLAATALELRGVRPRVWDLVARGELT